MGFLNLIWADLICIAAVYVLAKGAITGKFYSHGRSARPKLIASIESVWVRGILFAVAAGLSLWVIIDLKHKWGT